MVKSRPLRLVFIAIRIYLLVLIVLAFVQRKLLYFPTHMAEAETISIGEAQGFQPWTRASGEFIGWKRATSKPQARRLLVVHGNGGMALHRADYAQAFEGLEHGRPWDVRLMEYPGYGFRPGSPSRQEFNQGVAQAVSEWGTEGAEPVYLLGESLGSGPVCDVAAAAPSRIAGLILVTPFARLPEVAQAHFPFLPVKMLVRDRWDNVAALKKYSGPVAVIVAGRDEIVGTAQSETLFMNYAGRKHRVLFPEAMHNDSDIHDAYWAKEVGEFLNSAEEK